MVAYLGSKRSAETMRPTNRMKLLQNIRKTGKRRRLYLDGAREEGKKGEKGQGTC